MPVDLGRDAADHRVADVVSLQDGEQLGEVQRPLGQLEVCHALNRVAG